MITSPQLATGGTTRMFIRFSFFAIVSAILVISFSAYANDNITHSNSSTDDKTYFTDEYTGMKFVFIKGSCGETVTDDCVKDFYLAVYEVTQNEWKKIMKVNNSVNNKGGSYPVDRVSYVEITGFLPKMSAKSDGIQYRLPTASEWEYAALAGADIEKMVFSGDELCENANVYDVVSKSKMSLAGMESFTCNDGAVATNKVGSYTVNAFGLYDMLGNVSEWVIADKVRADNGGKAILKGGSCFSAKKEVSIKYNKQYGNDKKYGASGFRVAFDADQLPMKKSVVEDIKPADNTSDNSSKVEPTFPTFDDIDNKSVKTNKK